MMPNRREQLFRQLSILRKIQVNPHLKAKDLAEELEVSTRTIFRDITNLTESGFPLYFEEGYRLPESYFFPHINFDMEELIALFLSSKFLQRHKEMPFHRPITSAMEKIEATVQPEYRRMLGELQSQFTIGITEGSYEEASYRVMELIKEAMVHHRTLSISYHTFSSNTVNCRSVDPYGIFFFQDTWYMVAFCHLRGTLREFNIKRIKSAEITTAAFELPADFDVSHYVSHSWDYGEADPVEVQTLHSAIDARWIREGVWHPSQKLQERDDGSLIMTVKVRAPENMIPWILGKGSGIEILSPDFLRKAVLDELARALNVYGDAASRT
jgi:predicted DNA-binding transcriptional regulator YafY